METTEIEKMSEIEDTHWWFCGKRNLVKSCIKNSGAFLDIGCGTGANIREFIKHSNSSISVGVEFSEDAIRICKERVKIPLVRCSAEHLPFKNSSFDTITILDVLEHLDNDMESMKNIMRILKPKGKLIISVPAHMFLWDDHDILLHHKRRYAMKELESKLKGVGFKITKISYWNFLLFPMAFIYKILNKGTDTDKMNKLMNKILYIAISLDNFLIKKFYLPFGVSIFCIAEKM